MLHFFLKASKSISCNTEKTSRINKMSKSRDMGVTRKVIDDYFVSLRPLLINPPIYVDIEARSIYCHGTRRRRSETQTISIWSSETDWTWILIVKPKSQSHSLSFKKGNCIKAENLGHHTHQYFTFSYFRIYERVNESQIQFPSTFNWSFLKS